MATIKNQCSICETETDICLCRDCSKDFCFDHLTEHRQKITAQRKKIHNVEQEFRQILNDQKTYQEAQPLIQEIDQWENDSIEKIRQIAADCRTRVSTHTNKVIHRIEMALDDSNKQGIPNGRRNKCDEIDADQFSKKLEKLKETLNKSQRSISIKQEPTSLINNMVVTIPSDQDATWKEHGITIAGGHGEGNRACQLSAPCDIALGDEQTIYIADRNNHRIVQWKHNAKEGKVIVGGTGQLNHPGDVLLDRETKSLIIADYDNRRVVRCSLENPTDIETIIPNIYCSSLTMDKDGSLYVASWKRHVVTRWRRGERGDGTIVAGVNKLGTQLNQLRCPAFIFVDDDYSLYVSDYYNHRVMKWVKDANIGVVVAGGNGEGSSSRQLSGPQGITVDPFGQIYVVDSGNHRVMRWCEGAKEGTIVIGGNGEGEQANQLHGPMGLVFDRLGNLYLADSENYRIQKFEVQ